MLMLMLVLVLVLVLATVHKLNCSVQIIQMFTKFVVVPTVFAQVSCLQNKDNVVFVVPSP